MVSLSQKRIIIALIISILLFTLCFSLHITANTSQPEDGESEIPVINSDVSSDSTTSLESLPSEPVNSDASDTESSSTDSTDFSDLSSSDVSDESSYDVSSNESSDPYGESSLISSGTSSQEVVSLEVSAVSEGGAPDFIDDQYYTDGSYVYHGSYAGLSSTVSSDEKNDDDVSAKPSRSSVARRYANYAKWGMVIFGLISLAMLALLIYFNLKVRESKQLHPEWYQEKSSHKKRK